MAFNVTQTLKKLAKQRTKTPQIILEIEGIERNGSPFLFGALPVETLWTFDEDPVRLFDSIGLRFDTPIEDVNSVDVISLAGTSKSLSQQVVPDKSGTSSIATLKIDLVDKDKRVSSLLNFENYVDDILGRNATVFVSLDGATHPTDSIPVLSGYIDAYDVVQGSFLISISHPENLKRKEIYDEYADKLDEDINSSVTSFDVLNTAPLVSSGDALTTYVRIDDEIMRVNSKTATSLNVTRGQLNTVAAEHDFDADVANLYVLEGHPIDLALKIYLSNPKGTPVLYNIESFVDIGGGETESNAVFFKGFNIKLTSGVVVGDSITITGSPSNNGTYEVIEIEEESTYGSYIVVDSTLVSEVDSSAECTFGSQFNVLPEGFGLGLTNREVDVEGHLEIKEFNPANFPDMKFYLTEQIEGKEFIDKEIYFPNALYSIPRQAKISLKIVQPPLSNAEIVRLDERTITNIETIQVGRSTSKFFYNTIVYKYGYDPVFDKFRRGAIFRNETSADRIKVGTKQLTIEALGLEDNLDTTNLLERQQQRLLDRYKFAAQTFKNVKPLYEVGYNVEIGDVVVFGSENVQLTDLDTGATTFEARLVEVINKAINVTTGEVTLDLLETSYDLNARFGVVSPSSIVDTGSTTTDINLKLSYGSDTIQDYEFESEKWEQFIGERIRIHSPDYSFDETVTIKQVKGTNRNALIVEPALSAAPNEGYIFELPEYPATGDALYKDLFVYFNPQVEVTSGSSQTVFNAPVSNLYEGAYVYVSSPDYSRDSFDVEDVQIDSIVGTTVTLNKALGFTPQAGDHVELIGFVDDEGLPYRII